MNNSAQTRYNNAIVLPFLNLSLNELQELFELNDIPVTHTSDPAVITIPSGVNRLGFDTTPALPSDFVEALQLWESTSGLNEWVPMTKRDLIPHILEDNTTISTFILWAYNKGQIRFIAANINIDIKLDYIATMFNTPIQIKDINVNLPFTNVETYLEYKTAALCAMFIAENPERATALDSLAGTALSRSLGIPIKGMQTVTTRRRPFRHAFKNRWVNY